jgi:hypothetical protein
MGETLVRYYQLVLEKSGIAGKTKLAMETKIPSTRAALAPDSPENIALFRAAFEKVTGQRPPSD